MDRRHFLTAAIVAPLLAPASRTRVSAAADGSEIRGTLRRLTERGLGDNRATFILSHLVKVFGCRPDD